MAASATSLNYNFKPCKENDRSICAVMQIAIPLTGNVLSLHPRFGLALQLSERYRRTCQTYEK